MLNVKEAIQDMGGADVVAKLIPGATKNIVYHWSSANRVGPRFYLRFLELCNKMKVKVDPIKVMNGDNVLVTGQPLAGPVDQRVSALVEERDDA